MRELKVEKKDVMKESFFFVSLFEFVEFVEFGPYFALHVTVMHTLSPFRVELS